jgi:CHAT domain-containing protein/tetratricopeptide (TPR) repeat protein
MAVSLPARLAAWTLAILCFARPFGAAAEDLPRAAFRGEIGPGGTASHTLDLEAARLVRIRGEGQAAEIAFVLQDPEGTTVAEAHTLFFPPGPIEFSTLTESAGAYRIEALLLPGGRGGRYTLEVIEDRPAGPADKARVGGERAYFEAERRRIEMTAESLPLARESYRSALAHARASRDAAREADALTGLARVQDALGDKAGALPAYLDAVARHRGLGRRSAAANVLSYVGLVHDHLGDRPRGLAALEEGLAAARQAGDRRVEGITLGNAGLIHLNLGDKARALDYWERALVAHREAGNPRGEATILTSLGHLHETKGEAAKALGVLQEALVIRRAVGEPRDLAGTLNNIGAVFRNTDDFAEAIDYYTQALAEWRRAGSRDGEGATLHNLANIHESTGEYQQALTLYNQALPLFRLDRARVREGNSLTNLGRLYATLGDHRQATAALEEALAIHRAVGNPAFESAALVSLGEIHTARGEAARALPLLQRSLELALKLSDPVRQGAALLALARAQAETGDTEEAMASFARAAELHRTLARPRGEATSLTRMAGLNARRGAVEEGLGQAERALEMFRGLGDRPGEAWARRALAEIELGRGRLDAARAQAEAALTIVESLRARIASQELRSSYLATIQGYYELLIDVLMRLHREHPGRGIETEALQVAERARARGLLDILAEARADIRSGVDGDLLARERQVQHTLNAKAARHSRLLGEAAQASQDALARQIDALVRELDLIQAEIRVKSPRYAALVQAQPATLAEIQSLLDAETLLLEYSLGTERSYVWAVTASSVEAHMLAPRSVLEAAARQFRDEVGDAGKPAGTAAGAELGRALLGPLAGHPAIRRLVVVAEGALLSVPFTALPDPRTGRPLVRDHELVALPSASTLAVLRREAAGRPAATGRVAVLADPVYDTEDPRVRARLRRAPAAPPARQPPAARAGLSRLLGSRREAAAIMELAGAGASWQAVDFEASRAAATGSRLGRFRVVHFATHGVLDHARPELSGIVLSLVDEAGQPQDGFLRLHEVYNLRLGADLVVLSACQTGLGLELRGEGLIGLVRGFMYAGAPRVVATLWKVDDRATTELMRRFYAGMLGPRRLSAAGALREAQAALARDPRWRAPYYWAGFVLQGDWT